MIKQEKDSFSVKNNKVLVTLVSFSDKALWQKALLGVEYPFYQTWDYCNAIYLTQKQEIELLKISNASSGIVVTFSKRSKLSGYFDIFSPYGFGGITSWGDELEIIYETLFLWFKSNHIVTAFLMGHPLFTCHTSKQLESHRSTFVIDLTISVEKLWQNLGSGHKYEIKKIQKDSQLSITDDKQLIYSQIPILYKETIERVGASSSYHFLDSTLRELVFNDCTIVLGAILNNKLEAIIVVNYTKECAEYFLNASSENGRNMTRSLLWEAINRLKLLDVKKFNLGGGATEGDQLEQFKKRMGGERTPIQIYKKIINSEIYEQLCLNFNNNMESSYFPPYWKK